MRLHGRIQGGGGGGGDQRGGGGYARCNPHVNFEKNQKMIKQIRERQEKKY